MRLSLQFFNDQRLMVVPIPSLGNNIVLLLVISSIAILPHDLDGQGCCSGGSGSPIAGNSAQGVLAAGQTELASSFQWMESSKFLNMNRETTALFNKFNSSYLYSRIAFGVNTRLTVSVENGYYINKTQTELNNIGKIQSAGVGDLLLFPRYDVWNRRTKKSHNEITVGLGFKIPLGKYNDSHVVFTNPNTGKQYFTVSPPLVQPTNGSQDFLFYLFYMHSGLSSKIRFFANSLYIKKGWNPLGEKFGDFASVNLFFSRTLFRSLSATLQLSGEYIMPMQHNPNVDVLALYNVDVNSTGSRKISIIPQVSYTFKTLTFFGMGEIPLYQWVRGTQIAVQKQITVGLAYRFFADKERVCDDELFSYECPMKCKGGGSNEPGTCSVCGMKLEKNKN